MRDDFNEDEIDTLALHCPVCGANFGQAHAIDCNLRHYELAPPAPPEAPTAYAELERGRAGFYWMVRQCPFCGRQHEHGGGSLTGDPRKLLGHRVPECTSEPPKEGFHGRAHPAFRAGYKLIALETTVRKRLDAGRQPRVLAKGPPAGRPYDPRKTQRVAEAIALVRGEHGAQLYVELYCERPECPAREIEVHLKDYDDTLIGLVRDRELCCPFCGFPVKLHWARSGLDHARHDEALARESVNTQMFVRDLPADELAAVPATVMCDDRLPPTPPGWFDTPAPGRCTPMRVFRSKTETRTE